MSNNEVQKYGFVRCTECSAGNHIKVLELFGQKIAFRRFNADYTDMWSCGNGDWYCPTHAHIGMDMPRDEFEQLRKRPNFLE
jgi:hypothetical protein